MHPVRLEDYNASWYRPGRSRPVLALWFFLGLPLLRCALLPSSGIRVRLLRLFGARVGERVVIKPGVRVKYPWNLTVGHDCWIGEDCWIDNLAPVTIGSDCCLSQGAYLCTGNHDWADSAFGLITKSITLSSGSWVGAKAVLAPGVTLGLGAVAAMGSVVNRSIPDYEIHAGNPARLVKHRMLREEPGAAVRPEFASSLRATP